LLNREQGQEKVAAVMDRATINTVNLAEVITKLARLDIPTSEIEIFVQDIKFPNPSLIIHFFDCAEHLS